MFIITLVEPLSSTETMSSDQSIYGEYFRITEEYTAKYGPKTVLLMQVGAFFEVYGIRKPGETVAIRSCIDQFAQVGNLSVSEKKTAFENGSVVMAGFRDYTLDKYIPKLTEAGFTVVVFVQEPRPGTKSFQRVFDSVYSPGTVVSFDTDTSAQITNHIMCIWFDVHRTLLRKSSSPITEKTRDTLLYGVAVVNIFTGKSSLFEQQTTLDFSPSTFDELERYVSVFSPSELIVVSPFEQNQLDKIIQYTGVNTSTVHYIDSRNVANERVQNCTKQKYIRHLFTEFYKDDTYDICSEFQTYAVATQSFCYLLNFIQEHNPRLVRNIDLPTLNNTSYRMILANHTLKQLNILDDTTHESTYSSVSRFLNKCATPIGRRMFYAQLVNPVFDEEWLRREYDAIEGMLAFGSEPIAAFRKLLRGVCDMEKIMRQLTVRKLHPASIFALWKSIQTIHQTNVILYESKDLLSYLSPNPEPFAFIESQCAKILEYLDQRLAVADCQGLQGFEVNIIRPGISQTLDETLDAQRKNLELFGDIRESLNAIIRTQEKNADLDFVKVHETDKLGLSLQITKKRAGILKKYIGDHPDKFLSSVSTFPLNNIRFVSVSSTMDEIECPVLQTVARQILAAKQRLSKMVENEYLLVLEGFESRCYGCLEKLSAFVAKLDTLTTKAYLAQTYHYYRPTISTASEHSFVRATALRHCLIEQIQQNELYVPNDVELDGRGILLYGTNAVGKTSLIRALGIAVIMAQSGMFVPCAQFVYRPYTAIFSRILGNDNLFKGLSTFAVEMSELRTILTLSDERSLVLGDELCSGTETESALSIFMAGLCHLDKKRTSFVFATHFHEILRMSEMAALSVETKHMAVHYDRELDCLVYDRTLQSGPGNRMYGLEVCKSLHLPVDFMDKAYDIRGRYFPETRGGLSSPPARTYNANKIRGTCEMCHVEMGEETHHLQEQHLADANGFIGDFHKNHMANLMSLCSKCHALVHTLEKAPEVPPIPKPTKVVRKKTTKGTTVFVEGKM